VLGIVGESAQAWPERRFELFYYDFAWGALLCAAIAAFTFGTLNSKELTFQENLLIAGYRNMAFAFGAGMLFNFANMLLAAAITVGGMAMAFPIAAGVTLAITGAVGGFLNTGPSCPAGLQRRPGSGGVHFRRRRRRRPRPRSRTNAAARGRKGDRARHLRGHFQGRLLSHSPVWRVGRRRTGALWNGGAFRCGNVAFYVFAEPVFSEFSS
jgi:hypothetical protein